MKSWIGFSCILFVLLNVVNVHAQGPQRPVGYQSPEVDGNKSIFRIHVPNAQTVTVSSSDFPTGSAVNTELVKGEDGIWEVQLELPPGAYRYHFLVDGVITLDRVNPLTSQSNANAQSLVTISGSEWFDEEEVPHGAIAEIYYHSKSLGKRRRMHVYTPPGYEKGEGSYPVFYLLHGASDSDDSWTSVGRANFILDNLIAQGKATPMIVVMPNGHTGTFNWGGGGKPFDQQMAEFADDFHQDIRPYIEANYRTLEGRENRAIAGLSMGGAQTLNIAFANLSDYGYVGVFSSGVFGIAGGFNQQPNDSFEQEHLEQLNDSELKNGLGLVWFGIGKEDFLIETSRATVKMLKKHEFAVEEVETDGGHNWKNWRDYLPIFTQRLFK